MVAETLESNPGRIGKLGRVKKIAETGREM
jgi:hypothetical protein